MCTPAIRHRTLPDGILNPSGSLSAPPSSRAFSADPGSTTLPSVPYPALLPGYTLLHHPGYTTGYTTWVHHHMLHYPALCTTLPCPGLPGLPPGLPRGFLGFLWASRARKERESGPGSLREAQEARNRLPCPTVLPGARPLSGLPRIRPAGAPAGTPAGRHPARGSPPSSRASFFARARKQSKTSEAARTDSGCRPGAGCVIRTEVDYSLRAREETLGDHAELDDASGYLPVTSSCSWSRSSSRARRRRFPAREAVARSRAT